MDTLNNENVPANTKRRKVRIVTGLFVWSLEAAVFSLLAWSLYVSFASLGALPQNAAHEWTILVVMLSTFAHLVVQCFVAFYKRAETLERENKQAALHKGFAQGNCCEAQTREQWALVFFNASGVSMLLVAIIVLSFLSIMIIVAICTAFSATPSGEGNWLFLYPPLCIITAITYPLIHEIGEHELLLCTAATTNSLSVVIVNCGLWISYTFFVLDVFNWDPANAFKNNVLQSRPDREPKFRLYLFLHALFATAWLVTYIVLARTITPVVYALLIAAAVLAGAASFSAWPNWRKQTVGKKPASNKQGETSSIVSHSGKQTDNHAAFLRLRHRPRPSAPDHPMQPADSTSMPKLVYPLRPVTPPLSLAEENRPSTRTTKLRWVAKQE
jgi:hypothetical protein